MDYWTTIVWQVVIALAPIIVGICMKLVQDFILTRSAAQQVLIRSWIDTFVKMAQAKEPDPERRKAWVVAQICAKFPALPMNEVSALIEAILVDLKLEHEDMFWSELPPAPAE